MAGLCPLCTRSRGSCPAATKQRQAASFLLPALKDPSTPNPVPLSPARISQNPAHRYERPNRGGESDNEVYSQGGVIPADKIIGSSGFKVGGVFVEMRVLGVGAEACDVVGGFGTGLGASLHKLQCAL